MLGARKSVLIFSGPTKYFYPPINPAINYIFFKSNFTRALLKNKNVLNS